MNREYAIVNARGKVAVKCAVAPVSLGEGERLSVREQFMKTFPCGPKITMSIPGASGEAEWVFTNGSSYVVTVLGTDIESVEFVLHYFERFFDVLRDITPPKLKRRHLKLPNLPTAVQRFHYLFIRYGLRGEMIE